MRTEYIGTAEVNLADGISEAEKETALHFVNRRERAQIDWVRVEHDSGGLSVTYGVRKGVTIPKNLPKRCVSDFVRCDAALENEEILAFKLLTAGGYRVLTWRHLNNAPSDMRDETYTVADWSPAGGFTGRTSFFHVDEAEDAF